MNHNKQRKFIMDYLKYHDSHPTAEEIYKGVRLNVPKISLGTVYRNLYVLSEKEIIGHVHTPDGADHYDSDPKFHLHTYCMQCGKVENVNFSLPIEADTMANQANKVYGGYLYGFYCCFYGFCHECLMNGINLRSKYEKKV